MSWATRFRTAGAEVAYLNDAIHPLQADHQLKESILFIERSESERKAQVLRQGFRKIA